VAAIGKPMKAEFRAALPHWLLEGPPQLVKEASLADESLRFRALQLVQGRQADVLVARDHESEEGLLRDTVVGHEAPDRCLSFV